MHGLSRLPGPTAALWEWQFQGACRGLDPDLFFHPEGERGRRRRDRVAFARSICASCPVVEECRHHAMEVQEPYGVWGGLSEEERNVR